MTTGVGALRAYRVPKKDSDRHPVSDPDLGDRALHPDIEVARVLIQRWRSDRPR